MKTYRQRQEEIKSGKEKSMLGLPAVQVKTNTGKKPGGGIRILPNGIAVLERDTHISKWVEHHGRLDIEWQELETLKPYIPVGGTVIDVGALIGDHTVAYAKFVGPEGRVLAFEPNATSYAALRHNTEDLPQVSRFNFALGSDLQVVEYVAQENAGAGYIQTPMAVGDTMLTVGLDKLLGLPEMSYVRKVDFLKMDAEGFEPKILLGARKLIARDRPVLYFEVNQGALQRQGFSFQWLDDFLKDNGYGYTATDKAINHTNFDTWPQYNLLALP